MKYFILNRKKDISGYSGIGVVAEGIIFSDGSVVYRWLSDIATTCFADNIETVRKLHSHDDATEIRIKSTFPDYPKYKANVVSDKK